MVITIPPICRVQYIQPFGLVFFVVVVVIFFFIRSFHCVFWCNGYEIVQRSTRSFLQYGRSKQLVFRISHRSSSVRFDVLHFVGTGNMYITHSL